MKKFKFRLERVLQYRQVVREEKRRILALANSKRREAFSRLEELEAQQLGSASPDGALVDANMFIMTGLYRARLKEAIVQQKLHIIKVEEEVEAALAEYVEAAKTARSLELLKEKRQREYAEYVEKEDGKALDELVTQRIRFH